MPNVQKPDSVAVHFHSPTEVNGLARYVLGPPIMIPTPETEDPTSGTNVYDELEEMTETFTLPKEVALRWQVTARFSGQFTHSDDGGQVGVKLMQDGVEVPGTTRIDGAASAGGPIALGTEATVEIAGGTQTTIAVHWANPTNAGVATAEGVQRRLELTVRPITGVTP